MRSFLLGQSPTIAVYGSRSSRVAVEVHWLRLGVCAGLNELAAARRLFFYRRRRRRRAESQKSAAAAR